MEINTTARHFDLTPKVRAHGEERVQKFLRIFEQIQNCSLTLTKERTHFRAEITVHAAGGADLVGTDEHEDLFNAIDRAADRVESQLRKHKGRLSRKGRGDKVGMALAAEAEQSDDDETE
jgi:putative sigma-54 modulation protein